MFLVFNCCEFQSQEIGTEYYSEHKLNPTPYPSHVCLLLFFDAKLLVFFLKI